MGYIPFYKPDIPFFRSRFYLHQALSHGWLTKGPLTERFEKSLASYLGTERILAVNSGTSALHLAIKASGLKSADEVIIPTVTFIATLEILIYESLKPVLCDIHQDNWNMDPSMLEKLITSSTKAVIYVPLAGYPGELKKIKEICDQNGLILILDLAHALESRISGKFLWEFSDFSAYSFYATKNLTTAEGGALYCKDPVKFEYSKLLSLHGMSKNAWNRYQKHGSWRYDIEYFGYKYNMSDIHAAIGLSQIPLIQRKLIKRHQLRQLYVRLLKDLPIQFQHYNIKEHTVADHLFLIRITENSKISRDELMEGLQKAGIGYSMHFIPLYEMKAIKNILGPIKYQNSSQYSNEAISLPLYTGMSYRDISKVCDAVKRILNRKN